MAEARASCSHLFKGEGKYVAITNGKRGTMQEGILTQHGMPDALVVHEPPRQSSHSEDLPTANGKRVDVHLLSQRFGALHQLGCLPTQSPTYSGGRLGLGQMLEDDN